MKISDLNLKINKNRLVNKSNNLSISIDKFLSVDPSKQRDLIRKIGVPISSSDSLYYKEKNKPRVFLEFDRLVAGLNRKFPSDYKSITIRFNWTYTRDGETVERQNITTFKTKYVNRNILRNAATSAAIDYAKQIISEVYWDSIAIIDFDIISEINIRDIQTIGNLPLYGAKLAYPDLNLYPDNDNGMCVYNYLLRTYKTKAKSVEQLEKFFNKNRTQGLTIHDLEKFALHHKLSIYVWDLACNAITFEFYDKTNKDHRPIMGVVANGHFYECTTVHKQKMYNIISLKNLKNDYSGDILKSYDRTTENKYICVSSVDREYMKSVKPNTTIVVKNAIKLNDLYMEYLEDYICYRSHWTQNHVNKIIMKDDISIEISPQYDDVKEICRELNLRFTNQSISKIAIKLFKNDGWTQTIFNRQLRKIYVDQKEYSWNGSFVQPLIEYEDIKHMEVAGIDIQKQYTAIAKSGDFYTFDIMSVVMEYDINQPISHGDYFISKRINHIPIHGQGWYSYDVVKACLEYGLITHEDIKYYIKGNPCPENDKILHDFIDMIYNITSNNKVRKLLINTLIGSFGICKEKSMMCPIITQSIIEACYYVHKFDGNAHVSPITDKFYKVQQFKKNIIISSDIPIRLQIVNRANLQTYKLLTYVEKCNKIPYYIKTDCIHYAYTDNPIEIPKTDKIGEYRYEKIILEKYEYNRPLTRKYPNSNDLCNNNWYNVEYCSDTEYYDWTNLLKYHRVHIQGFAGSGKSFIIRQLQEHFGDKFLYGSYTNMAANNINGKTLHRIFSLSMNDPQINKKRLLTILSKYEGIIIDEVNQMPMIMFNILNQLPDSFRIFTFGDHRQETPVEPDKEDTLYLETPMFKQLVNCNTVILQKQCRADHLYAEACKVYHDTLENVIVNMEIKDHIPFLIKNARLGIDILTSYITKINNTNNFAKFISKGQYLKPNCIYDVSKHDKLNIVKTNRLRSLINHFWMKYYGAKSTLRILPHKSNTYGQEMLIYVDLPIVSTSACEYAKKNELMTVTSYDDNYIYISSGLAVPHNVFGKYFIPAYAITTYKIEGQTIDYPHTIWEFSRMNPKTRYTALTRTTDPNLITINLSSPDHRDIDEFANKLITQKTQLVSTTSEQFYDILPKYTYPIKKKKSPYWDEFFNNTFINKLLGRKKKLPS